MRSSTISIGDRLTLYVANVTLFDGRRVATKRGVVLVDDGRIAWVGAHARAPRAARSAETIDGAERTLSPGLIDCHVHLSWDGTADMTAESRGLTDGRAALKAARNLQRHLEAGVTAVRDLGAMSAVICDVARAVADGIVRGPRVIAAGRALTVTGGHGRGMFADEVDGADDLRKAVRRQIRAGARAIKLIATGGVVTPGIGVDVTAFTQEELDAAVDEAHTWGRPVAAHAHGAAGVEQAVRAGVDSVEHGSQISTRVARMMKERGTFHVATISPGRRMLDHANEIPDYAAEKSRQIAPEREASFRRTVRTGVRHAAGTDAGTPFNPHGGLPQELLWMVEWGMTPLGAMRAATSNAAELVGLSDAGTVEEGKAADLVLYDGNPAEDIATVLSPHIVMVGGRRAALPGDG